MAVFVALARFLAEGGCPKICSARLGNWAAYGDQLGTDILGANNFGIASVPVLTGLGRASEIARSPARPTYILPDLRGDRTT
jgi:Predicted sugar phosphatases of the HAD superfamily